MLAATCVIAIRLMPSANWNASTCPGPHSAHIRQRLGYAQPTTVVVVRQQHLDGPHFRALAEIVERRDDQSVPSGRRVCRQLLTLADDYLSFGVANRRSGTDCLPPFGFGGRMSAVAFSCRPAFSGRSTGPL